MVKTIDKLVNGQKIKAQRVPLWLRIFTTLFFMSLVFLVAAFITYVSKEQKTSVIASYRECINSKGSTLQKTYPAVCVTKTGQKFIQPLSPEEQKLLEAPRGGEKEEFCGGITGKSCPEGYTCKLDGSYPDAGGKCIKN